MVPSQVPQKPLAIQEHLSAVPLAKKVRQPQACIARRRKSCCFRIENTAYNAGQPWTESEHLGFLAGLKKLGKGNWRGISRLFVPSRTPTQVASHAQKHFLRLSGVTKRRSRFSTLDQAVSEGRIDHNIASPATSFVIPSDMAQAGAQSILEAAAHTAQPARSSPEWCSAYPPAVPSNKGFTAEHFQHSAPMSAGRQHAVTSDSPHFAFSRL